MKDSYPTTWPLRCPECGDRIEIELGADAETGEAGAQLWRHGHLVLFRFDGVTVATLEVVYEGR
jgi:hypothetical protein